MENEHEPALPWEMLVCILESCSAALTALHLSQCNHSLHAHFLTRPQAFFRRFVAQRFDATRFDIYQFSAWRSAYRILVLPLELAESLAELIAERRAPDDPALQYIIQLIADFNAFQGELPLFVFTLRLFDLFPPFDSREISNADRHDTVRQGNLRHFATYLEALAHFPVIHTLLTETEWYSEEECISTQSSTLAGAYYLRELYIPVDTYFMIEDVPQEMLRNVMNFKAVRREIDRSNIRFFTRLLTSPIYSSLKQNIVSEPHVVTAFLDQAYKSKEYGIVALFLRELSVVDDTAVINFLCNLREDERYPLLLSSPSRVLRAELVIGLSMEQRSGLINVHKADKRFLEVMFLSSDSKDEMQRLFDSGLDANQQPMTTSAAYLIEVPLLTELQMTLLLSHGAELHNAIQVHCANYTMLKLILDSRSFPLILTQTELDELSTLLLDASTWTGLTTVVPLLDSHGIRITNHRSKTKGQSFLEQFLNHRYRGDLDHRWIAFLDYLVSNTALPYSSEISSSALSGLLMHWDYNPLSNEAFDLLVSKGFRIEPLDEVYKALISFGKHGWLLRFYDSFPVDSSVLSWVHGRVVQNLKIPPLLKKFGVHGRYCVICKHWLTDMHTDQLCKYHPGPIDPLLNTGEVAMRYKCCQQLFMPSAGIDPFPCKSGRHQFMF